MRSRILILTLSLSGYGADLDELRATQQRLIAARDFNKPPNDEVPLKEVETAKRQLLAWAESRLQQAGPDIDPAAITKLLNGELISGFVQVDADDLDRLGDLDIEFSHPTGEPTWIQMTTDIGVPCGFDRSVYLFEWQNEKWNRRFKLEADNYERNRYGPQQSAELHISKPDTGGARLVLVTGLPPACMSAWHALYIRLFTIDQDHRQKIILEQTPLARTDFDIAAHLESAGAMIEFSAISVDLGILIRPYILHYAVQNGNVQRIEPLARSPRDFADEWLSDPWAEIAEWSSPEVAPWHEKLYKSPALVIMDTVRRCATPGDWQVPIYFDDKLYYFQVADLGESRFRMLRVSEEGRSDCIPIQ